ncbi:MAG: type II toxin-antitoxin system PemK/MazF family toxin [Limisphaerales bacterium]
MPERHSPGGILLAALVFTSQAGAKKRPVMVIRDAGDDDLLVAPVSGQAVRVAYDGILNDWLRAGLRLPSVVRVEKLATIEKGTVLRSLGRASAADWARVRASLAQLFHEILEG